MAQGDIAVKINYAASATPVEETVQTDTTQSSAMIHTSIDKTIGGNNSISCGATATNVFYQDYTTTTTTSTTLTSIVSPTPTGIDFIMVKIREVGSTGTPDCSVELSGVVAAKLIGVGDVCILRPVGLAGTAVEIFSSGATELAKIDILYGIES
jgi:hypothetical protein